MTPSTTQSDQIQSKKQWRSGQFQEQQGGRNAARDEENQEEDPRGRNQSPETDGDGIEDGDDVQSRSGKAEVHPNVESGDDPDDETAETKSR